jgi:hypothetical protein
MRLSANHSAISAKGRCGIHIFDKGERVNAVKYISVMNSKVKLHINISCTTIFQQDSAPCHTAKTVRKWFATIAFSSLKIGRQIR